jgi:ectoine hydroxylase-related dioxygenase (phytanoyl-CoA dioxygenase family)
MKRRVFKDEMLQRQFEENAYCIVPLLAANEVKQLEDIYYNNRVAEQAAIEITIKNADYGLNKKIRDLASAIVLPRIDECLDDYRMLHAGFIAKIPGKPNAIKLHQDSTFVDESRFSALNIWCPLTNVDEKNGALWIIKHSDRFFPGLRGQPFKEFDFNDIGDEVISKYGKMLPVKAGEAIIYDTTLLHYSKQNITENTRLVCNIVMVPTEAQAFYYHFNSQDKTLEQYEISDDFLLSYFNKFLQTGKIEAKHLNTISVAQSRKVTVAEFEERYLYYNAPQRTSFSQKLSSFFKRG